MLLGALLALVLVPTLAFGAQSSSTSSVTITSSPPSSTTDTTATFQWTAQNTQGNLWCSLDGGAPGLCSSPTTYVNLAVGSHKFDITVQNKWAQPSAEVTWTITASTTTSPPPPTPTPPPTISFTQTPASSTTATTASFAWSTTDTTSVSCKLDSGAAAACSSPTSLSSLAAGIHTFVATATGAGGTASASYSWTITSTTWAAPVITFTQTPASSTTSTGATFAWSTLNTTSVSCKLDSGAAATCTSPTSYNGLAVGTHTFVATATGQGGSTSASYSWTITSSTTTGTVRYASPSNALSTIRLSAAGDTVVFQSGSYSKLVLNKSFSGNLTVQCASGVTIAGVDTNGQSGYTFDSCTVAIPQNSTDISVRAVENHGPSQNITWKNCTISGGFIAWDVYGASGSWAKNITLVDSDVFGAGGDLIHTNGVDGLRIEHNRIHDPYHDTSLANPEHHDGWQPQNTTNAQFVRNIVYWTSGPGAYSGQTSNYLGQGIMISGDSGAVSNVLIANNLIDHYNGRPLNMNGASGVQVVDNTFQDSGDGISITFGDNLSGVSVWNNIIQSAYTNIGYQPSYFGYNWFTGRLSDGYLGNITGSTYWTGNPYFVDRTSYKLTSTSPARGKGTSLTGTPTIDLDGNARTSLVLGPRI